ncbi:MAG: hypothetical protein CM15mV12_1000 [uncultured marine virus]|nr:MAG: hypothetical protein CM15mV12_1000 [uncultured marine virus]
MPVSWSEFSNIHPFAPASQTMGYDIIINDLKGWLCEITGFDSVSFNQMQDRRVNMRVYLRYKNIIKVVVKHQEMYA